MRLASIMRFAPLLVLGPVTGPLIALAIICAKRGQWMRAGLCVTCIVAFYIAAPDLLGLELHYLNHH